MFLQTVRDHLERTSQWKLKRLRKELQARSGSAAVWKRVLSASAKATAVPSLRVAEGSLHRAPALSTRALLAFLGGSTAFQQTEGEEGLHSDLGLGSNSDFLD